MHITTPLLLCLWLASGTAGLVLADTPSPPPRSPRSAAVLDARIAAAREALAERPDDPAARLALGRALFAKAGRGDEAARVEAARMWEAMHRRDPDDPLVKAYHGSAVLQSAPKAWAPWKKGDLARRGAALLDEAVASAPEHVEVRLIRGLSTAHLPADFGRAEQSRDDLALVAAQAVEAVERGDLSDDLAAAALYRHGLWRYLDGQRDDALATWREARTRWPDAPAGLDADHAVKHLEPDHAE
jgi:tetratricopeptide (TPR) repeat protein